MTLPLQTQSYEEEKIVRVEIDEKICLATDKNGNELLRLEIIINEIPIQIRFPTYGQWDDYTKDLALMLSLLSSYAGNVQIPDDLTEYFSKVNNFKENIAIWGVIWASALRNRQISKLIEKIFFKYLRPVFTNMKGASEEKQRTWLKNNMTIDQVIKLFTAIFLVEEWIKKNAIYALSEAFQVETKPPSSPTFKRNLESNIRRLAPSPSSGFVPL